MKRFLVAYAGTMLSLLALDAVWLGLLAPSLYQQGIGHLMAAQPNLLAAAAFYLLYPVGLTALAVAPHAAEPRSRNETLASAALFGLVAYATYDLSNLATLKDWPLGLSLLDMAWGTLLSTVAAAAGWAAMQRFAPRR